MTVLSLVLAFSLLSLTSYCQAFIISFYNLGIGSVQNFASAPHISSWSISVVATEASAPNGFPTTTYTVKPVTGTSSGSPRPPKERGSINVKNLKQPSSVKPSESQARRSDTTKKSKKEKGKKNKDKDSRKSSFASSDVSSGISAPEQTCPSVLTRPFRLFSNTRRVTQPIIFTIEQDINSTQGEGASAQTTYLLSIENSSDFSSRISRSFTRPPNDLINQWLVWERHYGRFNSVNQTENEGLVSTATFNMLRSMQHFPNLWSNQLFDHLLGIDCRFQINAIWYQSQSGTSAWLMGLQFILNDPDNPINIFAQITPDNLTPEQLSLAQQNFAEPGGEPVQSTTGQDIPQASAIDHDVTGSNELPDTDGASLSYSSWIMVPPVPTNQVTSSHPVSIPSEQSHNPQSEHNDKDSGVGSSTVGVSSQPHPVTPDMPSGSVPESTGSLALSDALFEEYPAQPSPMGIQHLTLEPNDDTSGGLSTRLPTTQRGAHSHTPPQSSSYQPRARSNTHERVQLVMQRPPVTDEYIEIDLDPLNRPRSLRSSGQSPQPRFQIVRSETLSVPPRSGYDIVRLRTESNYDNVRLRTGSDYVNVHPRTENDYVNVHPRTENDYVNVHPRTENDYVNVQPRVISAPPRPPTQPAPILPPHREASQAQLDEYNQRIRAQGVKYAADLAQYYSHKALFLQQQDQKENNTDVGEPPATCRGCFNLYPKRDNDSDDHPGGGGNRGMGLIMNILTGASPI